MPYDFIFILIQSLSQFLRQVEGIKGLYFHFIHVTLCDNLFNTDLFIKAYSISDIISAVQPRSFINLFRPVLLDVIWTMARKMTLFR